MSFQEYVERLEPSERSRKLKPQYIIGFAVVVVAIVLFIGFRYFDSSNSTFSVSKTESAVETKSEDAEEENSKIYVHVSGAVNSPGLVELKASDRVQNAINAAGGAREDANLDGVNLAKKVEDSEQIVVPSKNDGGVPDSGGEDAVSSAASDAQSTSASSGKVNINTADSAQLQTISGIGPSKAQKIIDYRTANGAFKSVEDLTNVSGIGEKTLLSIKDQITV